MEHPPPSDISDQQRPRKQPKLPSSQSLPSDLTKVPLSEYVLATGVPIVLDPAQPLSTNTPVHAAKLAGFRAAVAARGAALVLLAAGQGSRFKASVPKVVHPFLGKPLARHALDAAAASDLPTIVVVGYERELVRQMLDVHEDEQVVFVCQGEQMGTGHAVYMGKFALPQNFDGDVIISYADNPGVDHPLLDQLLEAHKDYKERYRDRYGAMILTGSRNAAGQGAAAYGRIVRTNKDCKGPVVDIVEKKTIVKLDEDGKSNTYGKVSWTAQELDAIDEFNSGIVVARARQYLEVLANIVASQTKVDPPKYEYYATDFVKGLVSKNLVAEGYHISEGSTWKLEGANTSEELQELERKHLAREEEEEGDDEDDEEDDEDDEEEEEEE